MAITYNYGTTNPVVAPVATNKAIQVGDLVAISSGNAISAADFTCDTTAIPIISTYSLNFLTKNKKHLEYYFYFC